MPNPTLPLPNGRFEGYTIEEVPSPYLRCIADSWAEEKYITAAQDELRYRDQYDEHFNEEDD